MGKVTAALPANRVAALATFIAGLAGCATALAGAWPSPTTTRVALIAGSVATISGPLAHIIGSWFWDRTPAGQGQYDSASSTGAQSGEFASSGPSATDVSDDTTVTPDEWRERRYPGEQPANEPVSEQPGIGATPATPPAA